MQPLSAGLVDADGLLSITIRCLKKGKAVMHAGPLPRLSSSRLFWYNAHTTVAPFSWTAAAAGRAGAQGAAGAIGEAGADESAEAAGETAEQAAMARTRGFNVALREAPHDLQLWLDFAAYQDELASCARSLRLSVRLACAERAVLLCGLCGWPVRSKLLFCAGECMAYRQLLLSRRNCTAAGAALCPMLASFVV